MTALLEVEGLVKHFVAARSVFGPAYRPCQGGRRRQLHRRGRQDAGAGRQNPAAANPPSSRLVLRLIEPDAGRSASRAATSARWMPMKLRAFRRDAQIIFQDPYASLNPRMTVSQILTEPLALHDLVPAARRRERVEELLRLVGLEPRFARRYPHEFSGGQRQRIAIARALAVRAEADHLRRAGIRARRLDPLADPRTCCATCRTGLASPISSCRTTLPS